MLLVDLLSNIQKGGSVVIRKTISAVTVDDEITVLRMSRALTGILSQLSQSQRLQKRTSVVRKFTALYCIYVSVSIFV